MTDTFLHLVNLSITASFLIAAILVLRLLLKKVPKNLFLWLWALAGLRLALPISLESALSLIPKSQPIPPDIAMSPAPAVTIGIPVIDNTVNPVIANSFTPAPLASANPLQIILPILAALWLLGVVAMLLYALISFLRLSRHVSASIPLKRNLYLCDGIPTPFILGIVRPKIYLPSEMNPECQSYVLKHEYAHLRHHDHWWKPLAFLLLSIYWFNPLVWAAYILFCRDLETACDERAVGNMTEAQRKAYSYALLACAAPRKAISVCPVAFAENGVKARIRNVLHFKKATVWVTALVVLIAAVTAICFLTDPQSPKVTDFQPATAKAALVYDKETGSPICAYQENQRIQPYNLNKLAIALVVLENHSPEEMVDVTRLSEFHRYLQSIEDENSPALQSLSGGRLEMPLEDVLTLMLTANSSDAALALMRFDSGSEAAMVEKMNALASRICHDTHYVDLSGQGEGQYTTAYDTMLLVERILENPCLSKIWETTQYTLHFSDTEKTYTDYTHNYLLDDHILLQFYDPRVTGGFASQLNMAVTAGQSGQEVICILLGAEPKFNDETSYVVEYWGAFEEMGALLNTIFE